MYRIKIDIRNTELQEVFNGVDLVSIDDLVNKILDYKVELDSLYEKLDNEEE